MPGTPEEDYFKVCKANFMSRNSSIVQELFYGTFRSETTCPNCKHLCLKFEPFNMLSLPIPVQTKDTTMSLTFYFIDQYCLFDLVKVECAVGKDVSLKSIKDGYATARKIDPKSVNFYFYHGKTFDWKETTKLDEALSEVKFPDDNFFFLIEDNPNFAKEADVVHVMFAIEKIKTDAVVGIRKLTKIKPNIRVKHLYSFFFECLKQIFGDALGSFAECFSQKQKKDRLFDLYFEANHLEYTSESSDDQSLTLQDYSEIVVKIHSDTIRNHKKLNSLLTNHSEKYPDGSITLNNCFEALTNPEKLDEANKWFCEKCKQHTRANFRLSIKELPPILVIHLKRFKKASHGSHTKITDLVDFPLEDLKMADFTTDPQLPENQITYSLFGVVNHSGSVNFGHYTSVVANRTNPEQWVECDDETTQTYENGPHFYKNRAYILFYKRDTARPANHRFASSHVQGE